MAFVQDGVSPKIYINGQSKTLNFQVNTTPGAWFTYSWAGTITLGRMGVFTITSNSGYLNGSMDDVRYYKRNLTDQEILALYNNGTGTESLNPTVIAGGSGSGITFVTDVQYNAHGQITRVNFGNGDVTTYTYDAKMFRLTNITTRNASNVLLQNLSYAYDAAGNIVSITDSVHTSTQAFKYDSLSRLVEAVNPSKYGTKTFSYDTLGNLLTKDGLSYTYSATVNNKPHAVIGSSDGTTIGYDANGNMSTRTKAGVTKSYTYDAENRLKEVKEGLVVKNQFEYDGDGGRTKLVSYTSNTTTRFIGSLFETQGTRTTKNIYLGDQLIAHVTNGQALYIHADHLGGTNVVTDAAGVKKELLEYLPFGGISRQEKYGSSSEVSWFYFTGKKLDETGLYFYGARYYDPESGG